MKLVDEKSGFFTANATKEFPTTMRTSPVRIFAAVNIPAAALY